MPEACIPKLQAVGWDKEPYSIAEQRTITDGRIVPLGKSFIRRPPKRVDYLLRYRRLSHVQRIAVAADVRARGSLILTVPGFRQDS